METNRTIMVASTKDQKRYKITTNATTLGELKAAFRENGIDYTGMSFTEGITKTTLNDDASPLPANVPYKGQTTNNLVFLLTNTHKNIASGAMDRFTEIYPIIKEQGLQDRIQEAYGRNFTQVPTDSLETFLCDNGYVDDDDEDEGTDCDIDNEEEPKSKESEELRDNLFNVVRLAVEADLLNVQDLAKLGEMVGKLASVKDNQNLADAPFSSKEIDDIIEANL